jgi:hypothetical protein
MVPVATNHGGMKEIVHRRRDLQSARRPLEMRGASMQWPVLIAINLHVLSTVTWAGFTFSLSRMSTAQIEQFILPEIGLQS